MNLSSTQVAQRSNTDSYITLLSIFFLSTTMSEPPSTTIDPYEFLKIKLNPDGSLTRSYVVPTLPPSPTSTPSSDPHAPPRLTLSKDLPLNAAAKTSLRLFVPNHPPRPPSSAGKLPVVFYFHGGGFVLFSNSTVSFHRACESLAAAVPAVVVSVEYRLSPEHRLPAAYDDAVEAIQWVRSQALDLTRSEPWMRDYADFGKCFVMGNSCGGNIACFAGLRALDLDLSPL